MITRARTARKAHPCGHGFGGVACHPIAAGERYLEHTEFPGEDPGYATTAGHPVKFRECAPCAVRYGREHELGDVPTEQAYRQGLV